MKLIDSEKLLASMSARYDKKKNIVPDTLAEGFMQMDKLIHEQDAFDLEAHDKQIRAEVIDEYKNALLKLIKDEQDTRYGYLDGTDIREIAEQLKEIDK